MILKKGDYITCKRNFYEYHKNNLLSYNINGKDSIKRRFMNLFQKPIFKKNQKYKIENTLTVRLTTGTTCFDPNFVQTPVIVSLVYYNINNIQMTDYIFSEFFYKDKKEERKQKLMKLYEID